MTIDEMIAVLQAFKEGKKIQLRSYGSNGEWTNLTVPSPIWDFANCIYRIAPEPRKFKLELLSSDRRLFVPKGVIGFVVDENRSPLGEIVNTQEVI